MIKHYDAWHHQIAGLLDLISYFRDDFSSLSVIRKYPSIRFVELPTVRIIFDRQAPFTYRVERAWSRSACSQSHLMNKHTLEAFRRLWGSPGALWRHREVNGEIIFTLKGRVIHVAQAKGW
jgi:hypothetical protein